MSCFATNSLLIIITIANLRLLFIACYFFSQFLLISQLGVAFSEIPVKNYTFLDNNFIFPNLIYLSNGIPYTLRCCYWLRTLIATFALSIDFATWIKRFDLKEINIVALAFLVKSAKIDPDDAHCIRLKQTFVSILAFYKASFSANIESTSNDNWLLIWQRKKILHLRYLNLTFVSIFGVPFFQLLYFILVYSWLELCKG